MKSIISTLFILLFTLITGCDDNTDVHVSKGRVLKPAACNVESEKQFIFDVMKDTYLWYDQVPAVDLSQYDSANSLLDALRVHPDRFSYITQQAAHNAFFDEGTYEGFGFSSAVTATNDAYQIRYVFLDSASGSAGLKRTDKITAINGTSATDIIASGGINQFLSGYIAGDNVTFTVQTIDNLVSNHVLTKSLVNINTVIHQSVVNASGLNIGYVALSDFIDNTSQEFSNVVTSFKQSGINELVLDMRYNTGGRLDAANSVASLIGGQIVDIYNFSQIVHNDKYASSNITIAFKSLTDALNMQRIYVLTSPSTCSASELVINSLEPFIEVIKIGSPTCGKPIGMYGKSFCEKLFLPIELQVLNHYGQGDYFNGIAEDCYQTDNLDYAFADLNEPMFAEAVFHINNGICQPVVAPQNLISNYKTPTSSQKLIENYMSNKF